MLRFISCCTIGSLLLGLAAWILPVIALVRKQRNRPWKHLSVLSMAFCTVSLQLQLEVAANWARGGDASALLDCCNAQSFAGRCLLVVAFGLNLLLWFAAHQKEEKESKE